MYSTSAFIQQKLQAEQDFDPENEVGGGGGGGDNSEVGMLL